MFKRNQFPFKRSQEWYSTDQNALLSGMFTVLTDVGMEPVSGTYSQWQKNDPDQLSTAISVAASRGNFYKCASDVTNHYILSKYSGNSALQTEPTSGNVYSFVIPADNTTAVTIDIPYHNSDGKGGGTIKNIPVKQADGTTLLGDELQAGMFVQLLYYSSNQLRIISNAYADTAYINALKNSLPLDPNWDDPLLASPVHWTMFDGVNRIWSFDSHKGKRSARVNNASSPVVSNPVDISNICSGTTQIKCSFWIKTINWASGGATVSITYNGKTYLGGSCPAKDYINWTYIEIDPISFPYISTVKTLVINVGHFQVSTTVSGILFDGVNIQILGDDGETWSDNLCPNPGFELSVATLGDNVSQNSAELIKREPNNNYVNTLQESLSESTPYYRGISNPVNATFNNGIATLNNGSADFGIIALEKKEYGTVEVSFDLKGDGEVDFDYEVSVLGGENSLWHSDKETGTSEEFKTFTKTFTINERLQAFKVSFSGTGSFKNIKVTLDGEDLNSRYGFGLNNVKYVDSPQAPNDWTMLADNTYWSTDAYEGKKCIYTNDIDNGVNSTKIIFDQTKKYTKAKFGAWSKCNGWVSNYNSCSIIFFDSTGTSIQNPSYLIGNKTDIYEYNTSIVDIPARTFFIGIHDVAGFTGSPSPVDNCTVDCVELCFSANGTDFDDNILLNPSFEEPMGVEYSPSMWSGFNNEYIFWDNDSPRTMDGKCVKFTTAGTAKGINIPIMNAKYTNLKIGYYYKDKNITGLNQVAVQTDFYDSTGTMVWNPANVIDITTDNEWIFDTHTQPFKQNINPTYLFVSAYIYQGSPITGTCDYVKISDINIQLQREDGTWTDNLCKNPSFNLSPARLGTTVSQNCADIIVLKQGENDYESDKNVIRINQQDPHGFTKFTILKRADDAFVKAIASSPSTADAYGVVGEVIDDYTFDLVLNGLIVDDNTTPLAADTDYYLSNSTSGELVEADDLILEYNQVLQYIGTTSKITSETGFGSNEDEQVLNVQIAEGVQPIVFPKHVTALNGMSEYVGVIAGQGIKIDKSGHNVRVNNTGIVSINDSYADSNGDINLANNPCVSENSKNILTNKNQILGDRINASSYFKINNHYIAECSFLLEVFSWGGTQQQADYAESFIQVAVASSYHTILCNTSWKPVKANSNNGCSNMVFINKGDDFSYHYSNNSGAIAGATSQVCINTVGNVSPVEGIQVYLYNPESNNTFNGEQKLSNIGTPINYTHKTPPIEKESSCRMWNGSEWEYKDNPYPNYLQYCKWTSDGYVLDDTKKTELIKILDERKMAETEAVILADDWTGDWYENEAVNQEIFTERLQEDRFTRIKSARTEMGEYRNMTMEQLINILNGGI